MARRWRVLNRRRARAIRREADETKWKRVELVMGCDHRWEEEYYGHRCTKCDLFYAHDNAPWDYYGDEVGTDYVAAWLDHPEDYDVDGTGDCFHCGGDGFIDGYEDDPLWYAPGELERCSSCGGTGLAKDMTIW